MALNYEWHLLGYKKARTPDFVDVVVHADFEIVGQDEDGWRATYKSTVIWDPNDIEKTNFIPHDLLNDEQILDWVKTLVSKQTERNIEQHIREKIAQDKPPAL